MYEFNDLEKIFDYVRNVKLDHDKKEAIKEVDEFLNEHDNYEVTIGTYDYDGYNADRMLNGDGRHALQDITGAILVWELLEYYRRLDYNATAMVKIQVTNDDSDDSFYNNNYCYAVEYNGYELYYTVID
jgi:hypothetical protein